MRSRWLVVATVAAVGLLTGVLWYGTTDTVIAQSQETRGPAYTPPRTPWGDPDLQGAWRPEAIATPMERPARFGTRQFLTEEELAAQAKAQPVQRQERSEEESSGGDARLASQAPRSTNDNSQSRPHEAFIRGLEYNAWWTAGAPQNRQRKVWNRTSLIVDPPDGRMPAYAPSVLDRIEAKDAARVGRGEADSVHDRNTLERCLPALLGGQGAAAGLSDVKQILQAPGFVTMVYDGLTYARVIPVDGRPALDPRITNWLGEARGRWEGNTLVVEVTNINDKQDGGPIAASHNEFLPGTHQHNYFGSGAKASITERYTRVSPERIEYSFTLNDPETYARPYTILRPLEPADDFMFLENACHEGNYGMTSLLAGGRANEKSALIAAEVEAATRKEQLVEVRKRNAERLKASGR
jgi:hypothetical protein